MTFFIWCQFALVCLLGAMSPGPSLALIIHNTVNFNRISGIVASVAHGLGILVYATVTVIVLEFIIINSEKIFFTIQILGSIFLMFLGLIFLFKKNIKNDSYKNKFNSNSFAQGFIIAIINPKILVWFVAVYSQFIFVNSTFVDKVILVLTPSFIDAIWYSLVAVLTSQLKLKEKLNKRKFILEKIIGIFLIIISLTIIYGLINY